MKYYIDITYLSSLQKALLTERGYFVYDLRDDEGTRYTIEKAVLCNNIGHIVTNVELPLKDYQGCITDTEFSELGYSCNENFASTIVNILNVNR